MARNTLAVASQRSVRRISSGLKGTWLRQRDRGRRCTVNREGRCKEVLNGYYGFRQPIEQAELIMRPGLETKPGGWVRAARSKLGGITEVTLYQELERLESLKGGYV
jgi:hypothetical protein